MGWFILAQLFSKLITLVSLGRLSKGEKDMEILVLCQQISILMRNRDQPEHATQVEKLMLVVFTARLKEMTNRSASQLREFIRLFRPETVLRWHRELVRRKWIYPHKGRGGRPQLNQEAVWLKNSNCTWIAPKMKSAMKG